MNRTTRSPTRLGRLKNKSGISKSMEMRWILNSLENSGNLLRICSLGAKWRQELWLCQTKVKMHWFLKWLSGRAILVVAVAKNNFSYLNTNGQDSTWYQSQHPHSRNLPRNPHKVHTNLHNIHCYNRYPTTARRSPTISFKTYLWLQSTRFWVFVKISCQSFRNSVKPRN